MIKYLLVFSNFQQSPAIYFYFSKTNTQQCSAILNFALLPFLSDVQLCLAMLSCIISDFQNVQLFSEMFSNFEPCPATLSNSQQCPAIISNAQQ